MKVGPSVVGLTAVEGRMTQLGLVDGPSPWLSVMSEGGVLKPTRADVVMVAGHCVGR
jgi:hypothetical protein